jgi:hypothetical protein
VRKGGAEEDLPRYYCCYYAEIHILSRDNDSGMQKCLGALKNNLLGSEKDGM